jgi:GNAT superfamily N-acetyltransferase
MTYRFAALDDVPLIAAMNERLTRDENHRVRMTIPALRERMTKWLSEGSRAVVFEEDGNAVGYALFNKTPEHVYLKHFFVEAEQRRKGTGRTAIEWLIKNVWGGEQRIRLDVLTVNERGIAFWKSLGFEDYCITMELDLPDSRDASEL